jgi:hypothetical protein
MQYERTCSIERAEDGADAGLISGVLATDGEASDGHILNMDGVKLPDNAPLLFGHDDYTGTGNLGSWTGFFKFGDGKKLGKSGIRGTAKIEKSGVGSQAEWRNDVAHMIDQGHIGAFSVRWEEIGDPVARVNLPSDHPAFVDSKKANGRQRWGMYFDKWRLLEGSVVTLGADPAALLGRLTASQGDVRTFWRRAVNHALEERVEIEGLVGVHLPNGEIAFVERAVYDAMLEGANERMSMALDLHEEAVNWLLCERDGVDEPNAPDKSDNKANRSEANPDDGDAPTEESTPERTEAVAEPAPAPSPQAAAKPNRVIDAAALLTLLGKKLDESGDQMRADVKQMLDHARGRVSH